MNKFIMLFSLCMFTCTGVFAQSEDEDELVVYVSTGCNTSAAKLYHSTRYCTELKDCRHEHNKSVAKKCGDQCKHSGHVEGATLERAQDMGKTPCNKCCKELIKKMKKNEKKSKK